ncbi:MAG: aquaporin [Gemmatimonadaceae bacterium]|nr:aquaporin [Gemmatimonadaceae bacterium]
MRTLLRPLVAEFIGTFALTFVGGAAIMMSQQLGGSLLGVAFAHGLTLAVMVTAFMRISGHFNPAVTLGLVATRRLSAMAAAQYVVAQVIGAVAAAFLLKTAFPAALVEATRAGGQAISIDVTGAHAFLLEAVATFFLVTAVFATAVDPKGPKVGGFAIGLTVTVNILAIGGLTGASMNPARSFGPAVAMGNFEAQLIYWLAPITGGVLAALVYDTLFLRGDDA